ncbi:MAG: hypothetical protein IJS93_00685 [Clostridia bacterium]|nr:hypothetical protein [Clostridia bacterium]
MRSDILLVAVGGQNVKPYLDFFFGYAKSKGDYYKVTVEKGRSKEKCVERYSIHIGGGAGDITEGNADVTIALEQLEGVRHRNYSREEGATLVSEKRIIPISVLSRVAAYPENAFQKCVNDCFRVYKFDESDHIFACLLALKVLGIEKDDLIAYGEKTNLYTKEDVERVFAAKPVKA